MVGQRNNSYNICGLCCCFLIFFWILTFLGYLPSTSDFVNLEVKTQLSNDQLRRQIQQLKVQVKVLDRQVNFLQTQIGSSHGHGSFQRQKQIKRVRQFMEMDKMDKQNKDKLQTQTQKRQTQKGNEEY